LAAVTEELEIEAVETELLGKVIVVAANVPLTVTVDVDESVVTNPPN
jgi:hypothetical protein